MPDIDTHCKISKKRAGNDFRELHEWIDEPQKYIGFNHRIERHAYTTDYAKFIESRWGKRAVVEWLFHIAIDNLDTANKLAFEAYPKGYKAIKVLFDGKELSSCEFEQEHPNSTSIRTVELNK